MSALKVTGFLGLIPRTAERLLPDMAAQIAENVVLTSGEIRPMRPPYLAYYSGTEGQYHTAYRAYDGVTEKWHTWLGDVDVAKAALSPDVESRYYWTGDSCPRYATFTNFGTTDWALGIPNPTTKSTVSHSGGTGSATTRSYCYTFYQPNTGEESGPSPASEIATGKLDGTWTITGFSSTPTNDRAIAYNTAGLKQRLYRTAGTSASWQLVEERDVSTAPWTDTKTDAQILGDELISAGWLPPPVDLKGILTLPNGSCVGFRGNELCYSEPYQAHAYPDAYKYQTESEIIGIAAYGTTVVVATKTRPYIADGVTPDVVTMNAVTNIWPCKSKKSVCSVGDGVVYATEAGLAYVGQSGPTIFTKNLFTPEEWRRLVPSSMDVKVIDNRVFILYKPDGASTNQLLRIDIGEAAQLTTYSASYNALYADPLDGYLYLISQEVYRFDGTYGKRETFVWKSKELELPSPVNFGAALIEWQGTMNTTEVQAAYALWLAGQAGNQAAIDAGLHVGAFAQVGFNTDPINGSSSIIEPSSPAEFLKFTLLDHDDPVATVNVVSGVPFRLPGGYKSDVLTMQLQGNVRVKYIKLGETMQSLKGV